MTPYFSDDFVTLFYGNCLEVTQWLNADVLVTDPPYGISYRGIDNYTGASTGKKTAPSVKPIAHDSETFVRDSVLQMWGERPAIVFGSWRAERPALTKHRLIWHKAGMAPGPVSMPFQLQDEEIYVLGDGFVASSPPLRSVITTGEARSIEVSKIGHPTPKPIGLMELLIERCPAGVIADPFAGSGSTLIAARNLGRKAVGVELEESYCEIVAKRLSQQAFNFEELTA